MKKIGLLGLVLAFGLMVAANGLAAEEKLMIADFDSGEKPNNIGGNFGAWDRDPKDFTQSAFESFNAKVIHGKKGFSLRLDYDVDSPNTAYNGLWMELKGKDFSEYSKLVFWVKGAEKKGSTKVFKLEFKNNAGETGKYYVTGINNEWQKIEVPFTKFAGITEFNSMQELVIVIEDRIATDKEGAFYIDDVYVTAE